MPETLLPALLHRHHAALRRAWMFRHVFGAFAAIVLLIAGAVLLGVLVPPGPTTAWLRATLTLLAALALVVLAARRQIARVPRFSAYLEGIESRHPAVRSWLRNALELEVQPPVHGSRELAEALSRETAQRVGQLDLAGLAPRLEPRRPAWMLGAGIVLLVALGILTPARTQRSWATLLDPSAAAPAVELSVEPGAVRVSPGAALAIRARVVGTPSRPRIARDHGPAPVATLEGTSEGARVWRFDLPPITREDHYRVAVLRTASPQYAITLSGEPAPVSFDVEYRAPAYARLPLQRGASTSGDLSALRGTHARVEVTFDRDLAALQVSLPGGAPARFRSLSPRRWVGEVPIEREGEWRLDARAGTGQTALRYRITPLADAPPVIAVRVPLTDLDLPAGQQIPLDVVGQDDLGLSALELQVRKDPAAPWTRVPLARFEREPREAGLASRWDASSLGLLPGETATFRFALYDNNASGRGVALSPTFELRFPSLAQLYDNIDQQQAHSQNTLEKVADQTRELQKQLDKMARQAPTSTPQGAQSFERQEEMKNALEHQAAISQKLDDAAQQLRQTLEQAGERKAFSEELTRKLRELSELMNQIQSPELKDALAKMQQALEQMDRQSLEQNLPEWRRQTQETLANLERSIELMKRLREEEKLDAFSKRAEELEREQDALNQEHASESQKDGTEHDSKDAAKLSEKQQQASKGSQKLAEDVKQTQQQMDRAEAQQQLEQAQQELTKEAAEPQSEAAQSTSGGKPQQALQQGQRASAGLKRAGQRFQQLSEQMRREREGADVAAVRRAAQDLVSLQRESESNLSSSAPLAQRSDRQTDLSEGVSRVTDSLSTLADKTPFLSPRLRESLGRAIQSFSASGRQMGVGDRQQGEEAGRTGSAALNEAVLSLRQTESAMCQKPGENPGGRNNAERMGEMGRQQSQLNQESRSLAQRLSQQMRLSTGDRQEMQRLSQEQQRIREQVEQMQQDEERNRQLLGRLDAARRDMQDVEEALRAGPAGDEIEEKQQRILSRLLDAQRSVNQRDFNPERESRTGGDISRASPAELPRDLMRETDRLRLDLLKAEADRYPAQYRAFIEAYLRSLNASRR